MAKKNKIEIDVKADDEGSLKKVGVSAKNAAGGLEDVGTSAHTADRRLKGAADTSSSGTKNFSKMSQGVGGLVGAYATLAAQVFAVSAAFQFLKSASEISNLIAGQEALGAVTGVAYKTITASIKDATDGQLEYAEAAKAAAIGTAAGLSPDQLNRLAGAAKNVSNALGRDLTDSFNRLIRGTTKAEPELLDELGIILRLDDATKNYANAMNITGRDLTTFEKSQAIANEVLGQAEEKFGAIEKIMDPSAASLNRFLASFDNLMNTIKEYSIGVLRPIFDFLANNTLALAASMALLAIPILKSIMPAFGKWEKSASASLGVQQAKLESYENSLSDVRTELMLLGEAQDDILKETKTSSSKVLGDMGKSTAPSKSGDKGTDFLLGNSDSKKAQANADRILKNAQAQMRKHGKIMTGELKGASDKQLQILQRNFDARVRLIKRVEVQSKTSYKAMELHVKKWAMKAKIAMNGVQQFATKWSKKVASATSKAFALAGWVGMIAMVVEGLMELWKWIFPLPDKVREMREQIEEFTDNSKSLNAELSKMGQVRGLISLEEQIKQTGAALTSANIEARMQALATMDKGEKGYDAAKESLAQTFIELGKVNPKFAEFAEEVRKTGTFAEGSKKKFDDLAKPIREAAAAFGGATDRAKALREEFKALAGGGTTVDPTVKLRELVEADMEAQQHMLTGIANNAEASQGELDKAKEALKKQEEKTLARQKWVGGPGGERKENDWLSLGSHGRQWDAAQTALDEAKAKVEALQSAEDTRLKQTTKITAEQQKQDNLLGKLNELSKTLTDNFATRLGNEEKMAKNQTLGITHAQKMANLDNKRLADSNKLLLAEDAVAKAKVRVLAAEGKNQKILKEMTDEEKKKVEANQQELLDAGNALKIAESKKRVVEDENKLSEKQIKNSEALLQTESSVLEITIARAKLEEALIRDKRIHEADMHLFAGSALERAKEEGKFTRQVRDDELAIARKALEATQKEQETTAVTNEKRIEALRAQEEKQQERIRQLEHEAELEGSITAAILARQKGKTKDLQEKLGRISLTRRETFANEEVHQAELDAAESGKQIDVEAVKKGARAQFDLNEQIKDTQALYNTVEDSMAGAFEGIITGAKTAKEAFRDMAKAILGEIAKIIAKKLAMRAIDASISMMFADGGVTPPLRGQRYTVGGMARGPSSGYNAVLHGNEAVVPLPSGGKIPVEFPGGPGVGMGQQNNVSVTVNMGEGGGTKTDSDSTQGAELGSLVAKAVQEELHYQKRAGGILNPYGAS